MPYTHLRLSSDRISARLASLVIISSSFSAPATLNHQRPVTYSTSAMDTARSPRARTRAFYVYRMWTPPPDPDEPDCPYLPGFEVEIETHVPQPPFGGNLYASGPHASVTDEWIYSVTQTKHILTYPPLKILSPAQHNIARLIVTKSLAIRDARGAQILLCSVAPQEEGAKAFAAVAKVYDPLYYFFSSDIGCSSKDVVRAADEDYSKEAASYECLCRANQARLFAPAFFGSRTFCLPISHDQKIYQRYVRLFLFEYLEGVYGGPFRSE